MLSASIFGGDEIIKVHHQNLLLDLEGVCSLLAAAGGRERFDKSFSFLCERGWRRICWESYNFWPDYPFVEKEDRGSYLAKNNLLVHLNFNSRPCLLLDLARIKYLYNELPIRVGVEIVPCHFLQKQMSSGVSYGEQLIYDLERLSKNFPSVPVKIMLIDMPLDSDDYEKEGRLEVRQARNEVNAALDSYVARQKE
jgi:hypothetical protein